ncbi:MAG: hypothetical protein ACC707_09525 [Thiohalomonadales bacterium]
MGAVSNDYPNDFGQELDRIESFPGVSRTELALDFLGFYWPLESNDTLGFIINGTSDTLVDAFANELSFNTYLYALSYMRYFGVEPGDGFFYRGDIGIAKSLVSFDGGFGRSDYVSGSGYGYLLGIGYGLPISTGTRIIFGLNYTDRKIDSDTYKSSQVTIGFLW